MNAQLKNIKGLAKRTNEAQVKNVQDGSEAEHLAVERSGADAEVEGKA